MESKDLQIPAQTATLRMLVEDRLREAICSGLFKPGKRLVERELCELMGVGRTSVREALRQLEAEGLVETMRHRGPVVRAIDALEAEQLYAARALIEGYAGRMFARHGSREEIAALEAAVGRLEEAIGSGEHASLIAAKTGFYAVLMSGVRNVFLQDMLQRLNNRVTLLRVTSMTQPGRLQRSLEETRAIQRAIAAGDPDAAEAACHHHIEEAAKVALDVLSQQQAEAASPRAAAEQGVDQ